MFVTVTREKLEAQLGASMFTLRTKVLPVPAGPEKNTLSPFITRRIISTCSFENLLSNCNAVADGKEESEAERCTDRPRVDCIDM